MSGPGHSAQGCFWGSRLLLYFYPNILATLVLLCLSSFGHRMAPAICRHSGRRDKRQKFLSKPTESGTLGAGPSNLYLNTPSRGFSCLLSFKNHWDEVERDLASKFEDSMILFYWAFRALFSFALSSILTFITAPPLPHSPPGLTSWLRTTPDDSQFL